MRNIFGFGVVLAVAGLMATVSTAYGQAGAGRARGGRQHGLDRHQRRESGGERRRSRDPRGDNSPGAGPGCHGHTAGPHPERAHQHQSGLGTAGNVVNPAGTTTPTGTNYQVPGTAGNVLNQTGVMPTTPGTVAPGTVPGTQYAPGTVIPGTPGATTYSSNYYAPGTQAGTNPASVTAATPGYAGQVMPGMAGYNSVNPMGTTMAPGYYYAGTAGMPYATSTTPGYYTACAADLHRPSAERPLRWYLRPPESRRLSRQFLRDDLYHDPVQLHHDGLQHRHDARHVYLLHVAVLIGLGRLEAAPGLGPAVRQSEAALFTEAASSARAASCRRQ